jgi:hypothetical protein
LEPGMRASWFFRNAVNAAEDIGDKSFAG